MATTSTGPIARRISGLAAAIRIASRTVTTENRSTVRTSRSGRTHASTTAGSESMSWKALAGQSETHDSHCDGVG
jgi:hypothetical protein